MLAHSLTILLFGWPSDWLANKYSTLTSRRVFCVIGFGGVAVILYGMKYIGCNVFVAVAVLTFQFTVLSCQAVCVKVSVHAMDKKNTNLE